MRSKFSLLLLVCFLSGVLLQGCSHDSSEAEKKNGVAPLPGDLAGPPGGNSKPGR